jgi:hypothetical protein
MGSPEASVKADADRFAKNVAQIIRDHGVSYFPTQLVDHYPLDGADLILIGASS